MCSLINFFEAINSTEETLREFLRENTAFRTGGGNGSGVTQTLIGFIDYNDTTGSISLTANTWTDLSNNGAGSFTNNTYYNRGFMKNNFKKPFNKSSNFRKRNYSHQKKSRRNFDNKKLVSY